MDFFSWDLFTEISTPKVIPKSLTQKAAILKENYLIVLEKSLQNIHKKNSISKQIPWPHTVTQISCNASLALLITAPGEVWGLGSDESKSGLLCADNVYKADQPLKLEYFCYPISKVSLGPTHAACISESGSLFTWGSGQSGELGDISISASKPYLVTNASFFKSSEVACGPKQTAVCTEAGLLFIFGKRHHCGTCQKSSLYPITLRSLSDDFILKLISSGDELVIHNERGEVKVISKCFCIQNLGNKGKICDFASFEGGVVGMSADKRVFHIFRRDKKGWTSENALLTIGEAFEVVSSPDKAIGVVGRGIVSKGVKKVSEIGSGNTSFSTNDRVSFEEIVQNCGFKGKNVVDPGEIVKKIDKMILYLFSDVFRSLKACPKRKMNSLMTLSSRFISVSIEKYWNIWSSFSSGYKKAISDFRTSTTKLKSILLRKTLNSLAKQKLADSYTEIINSASEENKKNCLKSVFFIYSKHYTLGLSKNFHKINRKCMAGFKANSFIIDPKYKIEIVQADESNFDQCNSPVMGRSFMSDSDLPLAKFCSSPLESQKPQTMGFSNSMNLSNSPSPISDFSPSSPADTSPKISSFKNPNTLCSQMNRKIGEKVSPNIKISSNAEKNPPKSMNRGVDRKKHFTVKEPEPPKLFTKKSLKSSEQKRQTMTAIDRAVVRERNFRKFKEIFMRVLRKRLLGIVDRVKVFKVELKKNNCAGSGKVSPGNLSPTSFIQGNWKNKLYSLGLNKLGKTLVSLCRKQLGFGMRCVKGVE